MFPDRTSLQTMTLRGVLVIPSTFFSINFCSIRGIRSDFYFVEHHLFSSKPLLLFLTETQVSEATDSSLYTFPSHFLYPKFQTKAGSCV